MASSSGPSIVTNGLIASIDAANRKSVIDAVTTSLINTSAWTVGTGGVSGYNQNGNTAENARILDTDPWGVSSVVWETRASGDGNADGGWNTDYPAIDPTKLYRFSVWVRRTSSTSGGTFYFGTGAGTAEVRRTDNSAAQGNPYWDCQGTGVLTQNQWYLVCGHIYPHFTTYAGKHPNTGYFTIAGGTTKVMETNGCNIGQDLKWDPASTSAVHRAYHFYCADATTRLQFAYPRIDVCDGNEPSIKELLDSSPRHMKNTVGSSYKAYMNSQSAISGGAFNTTGAGVYAQITDINLATGTFTIMGASRYTGATRGRIISQINNNWLLGHWSNSTENYYANGWVTAAAQTGTSDTVWRIQAGTGDSVGDLWKNYVNGVLVNSNANGTAGPNGIQLGGNGGANELTDGQVGFLLVYNRVLTDAEIQQNFNALRGRFGI